MFEETMLRIFSKQIAKIAIKKSTSFSYSNMHQALIGKYTNAQNNQFIGFDYCLQKSYQQFIINRKICETQLNGTYPHRYKYLWRRVVILTHQFTEIGWYIIILAFFHNLEAENFDPMSRKFQTKT